ASRCELFVNILLRERELYGTDDVIVVTHGVTLRVLVMMALNFHPEWLEVEPMPGNAAVRILDDNVDKGYLFKGFMREAAKRRLRKEAKKGEKSALEEECKIETCALVRRVASA